MPSPTTRGLAPARLTSTVITEPVVPHETAARQISASPRPRLDGIGTGRDHTFRRRPDTTSRSRASNRRRSPARASNISLPEAARRIVETDELKPAPRRNLGQLVRDLETTPAEAIVLGDNYELSFYDRRSAIYTKEMLLEPVPSQNMTTPQKVEPGKYDRRSVPEMADPKD